MRIKSNKNYRKLFLISYIFLLISAIPLIKVHAAEVEPDPETEGPTEFIFHHIANSYDWHFATIGHTHVTLPLPLILYSDDRGLEVFMSSNFLNEDHNYVPYKGYALEDDGSHLVSLEGREFYDFSLTKNVAAMILSVIVMLIIFPAAASRYKKAPDAAPQGIQAFLEPVVIFIRDEVAIPAIGEHKYQRFMPYLLTVFFFILVNNLLGLLPGAANVTGNISITLTLATFTFIITQFSGNKNYWKHVFNTPGVPWWLLPIMIPVEIIGLFTKPFSLMVRLFANITAGHIIILSIIGLIFIFESIAVGPVSVLFAAVMNFLELLVAFLQAFVFTLLSAIYFGGAVEEHHHEEGKALESENGHAPLQSDSAMV
ncbi:F-type H+-transporting ATPase subunit a [Catalinimonas alkaloidigena]|uniref:F0F1 ATP synthase subunit A n=1 Tax=Catalinimonas alkaloidigena TaxID=1075417 RepID=UPI0024055044|nr:F0F1 ATP synthase subunit A [Catalinimonas alkaloidigena]MDF9798305.1 F-type H+-transporting ATPase subunit a [Catalinimonas alkaloidigena]